MLKSFFEKASVRNLVCCVLLIFAILYIEFIYIPDNMKLLYRYNVNSVWYVIKIKVLLAFMYFVLGVLLSKSFVVIEIRKKTGYVLRTLSIVLFIVYITLILIFVNAPPFDSISAFSIIRENLYYLHSNRMIKIMDVQFICVFLGAMLGCKKKYID